MKAQQRRGHPARKAKGATTQLAELDKPPQQIRGGGSLTMPAGFLIGHHFFRVTGCSIIYKIHHLILSIQVVPDFFPILNIWQSCRIKNNISLRTIPQHTTAQWEYWVLTSFSLNCILLKGENLIFTVISIPKNIHVEGFFTMSIGNF